MILIGLVTLFYLGFICVSTVNFAFLWAMHGASDFHIDIHCIFINFHQIAIVLLHPFFLLIFISLIFETVLILYLQYILAITLLLTIENWFIPLFPYWLILSLQFIYVHRIFILPGFRIHPAIFWYFLYLFLLTALSFIYVRLSMIVFFIDR